MENKELYQPLRFYSAEEKQNRYRRWCLESDSVVPVCPTNQILPFQIMRDKNPSEVVSVQLRRADILWNIELYGSYIPTNNVSYISIKQYENHDLIIYYGSQLLQNINKGLYYIRVIDGAGIEYYSEVFRAVENIECYTKLTYWAECDIGDMYSGDGVKSQQYKHVQYLDIDLTRPKFKRTEQSITDGLGEATVEWERLIKTYQFEVVVPEFTLDSLNFMTLFVNTNLHIKAANGEEWKVKEIHVGDPEWQGDGCDALVSVEFAVSKIVKAGCCTDSDDFMYCITPTYYIEAVVNEASPEYGNYEYQSYNNNVTVKLEHGQYILKQDANGGLHLEQYYNQYGAEGYTPVNMNDNNRGESILNKNQFPSSGSPSSWGEKYYNWHPQAWGAKWWKKPQIELMQVITDPAGNEVGKEITWYGFDGADHLIQGNDNTIFAHHVGRSGTTSILYQGSTATKVRIISKGAGNCTIAISAWETL